MRELWLQTCTYVKRRLGQASAKVQACGWRQFFHEPFLVGQTFLSAGSRHFPVPCFAVVVGSPDWKVW
ncbi:MAG: hypothetical protein H7Y43_03645 [Akkermansiaceae bacterium]|nr:hypothetical protein [Verrucomicrobiales bacterium]